MESIVISFVVLIIFFFSGLGISSLLLNSKYDYKFFWLIPWMGAIILLLLTLLSSFAKLTTSSGAVVICMLVSSFLIVFALTIKKRSKIIYSSDFFLMTLFVILSIFILHSTQVIQVPVKTIEKAEFLSFKTMLDILSSPEISTPEAIALGGSAIISLVANLSRISMQTAALSTVVVLLSIIFPLIMLLIQVFIKLRLYVYVGIFLLYQLIIHILFSISPISIVNILFFGVLLFVIYSCFPYLQRNWKTKKGNLMPSSEDFILGVCLTTFSVLIPVFIKITTILILVGILFLLINKKWDLLYILIKVLIIAIVINPITFGIALNS